MIRLLLRLLYDVIVFPLALIFWALRRSAARRPQPVKLHLKQMPDPAPGRIPFTRRPTLGAIAEQLDAAAERANVTGCLVVLEAFEAGAADLWELGALLDRFSRSGKPLHVHVEEADTHALIAAAPAGRLTTSPAGSTMVHGVGVELRFLGELFDRYGVEFQVVQRREYKGSAEPLTRREPSEPLARSLQAVVDDTFEQLVRRLARRPGWTEARAHDALAGGPYALNEAIERGLLDAACHADEAEDALAAATGVPEPRWSSSASGAARRAPDKGARPSHPRRSIRDPRALGLIRPRARPLRARPQIAFVPVMGIILDRPVAGIARRLSAAASQIAPRIRALADARGVEAIVIVIDSRGGTASGSERIWNATRYALGRKPVVAWMRSYAASGGYYVAAAAEQIIASPFTITGSIGVITVKPNLAEAAGRLGVNPVFLGRGGGANLMSPFRPFDDRELAWLAAKSDELYERFKAVVAEGRRMDGERVEELARGRIWTGPQAYERGLIDRIGAYGDVVDASRTLAGIPSRRRHDIVWAAPPQGAAQWMRRFMEPTSARDPFAGILDPLVQTLLVQSQGPLLYYLAL